MSFVTSSRPNQLGITDVASLVESIYELFT